MKLNKRAQVAAVTLLAAFAILAVGAFLFSDEGITGLTITNATFEEEPLPMIIELKNQRVHETSKAIKQKHKPELEALSAQANQIYKKVKTLSKEKALSMSISEIKEYEDSFLTAEDKKQLKSIAKSFDTKRDKAKKEIYSTLTSLVEDEQDEVKAAIEACGGTVHGEGVLINSIFARILPSCISVLEDNDLVAGVYEDKKMKVQLDDSVCATGAPTWHTAGYNGSGWDLAVVDTGIDGTHPALTVASASTFHTIAQFDPDYNDNSGSTDDLHGHGTHCGGIVASTDSTYQGIAYGGNLINAKAGWLASPSGAYMYWSDMMDAVDWATNTAGADVISLSFGSEYSEDDDCPACRYADAVVDDLGVSFAIAAGNDGPSSPTIGKPAIAFNIFSVANIYDGGECDRSDDYIWSSSSRGPTYGGRVKPDIAAPGTSITSTNDNWEGIGSDFVSMTGTSMAAPHVAGAALLVLDYKASSWDPKAVKALLLNTADNDGTFSTKTAYGWGYMNLTNAYINKDNVVLDNVNESSIDIDYKYYNVSLSSGGKATIVWNRHVVYAGSSYPSTYYSLNNIDLYLYNESDGNLVNASTSTVENVEQVLTPYPLTGVIKVQAVTSNFQPTSSNYDSFGLAAEGSIEALTGPSLVIDQNLTSSITDNLNFTISVNISNIGDLNAHNVQAGLVLPAGLTIVSGSNPRSIGTLSDGNQSIINWTIKPNDVGTYNNIYSNFTSSGYGESLNGTTSADSITINDDDSTPPAFSNWNFSNTTRFDESNDINVTVTDSSGLSTVRLYYDYGNDSSIDGSELMNNIIGDIWNATINAPGISYENQYVGFFVEATDNDNDRANDQLSANSTIQIYFVNNEGPNITSYYPPTAEFSIAEPSNQTFNITYTGLNNGSINWYRNGTLVSSSDNYTFYGNYSTAGFYNITVIINDGDLTDTQTWNFTVNNTNRHPVAQNLNLISTDSLNRTNGNLTGAWSFYDPDEETQLDNETKWYNNSVELTSLANLTAIGSGNTSKNQDWLFSVRVYDGYDWSNWSNSTVLMVQNTIPTAPIIDLNPDSPGIDDDLWCNVTTQSNDIDSDTIQYYYEWYKGSILNRTTLTTQLYDILERGNTSSGDIWNCTVRPYDGEANGTAVSDKVIVNTPPEAVNVTISSTDNLNRTNGTLIGNWDFYDADNPSQQANETKWYNNSVEVVGLRNLTIVGSGNTSKNDVWVFSVRVYDDIDWSVWVNSTSLTIQNTPPTAPIVDLSPDVPVETEDIWCNVTINSTDADNGVIQYYYEWYKNSILNRTTLKTQSYDVLGSGNTSTLDEWNCTVIPYDGEVNGSAASGKVMVNNPPEAVNVTLSSTDNLNRTNGTLIGSWDFYDVDGHSQQSNETKWYNNSVEVASLAGLINIGSLYTRRNQNWTFSVRVYDGYGWSVWVNSSILTIQNLPPVLATIADITVNETELINITANAVDEDALTYDINDTRFTKTDNHFTWQTTMTDSGVYVVAINVTDGSEVDSQNVTVTVLDAVDFDNDGNPDFNDTDDDNDGIDDSSDRLTGNLTDINSTTIIKLKINGSENTTKVFDTTLPVNITDDNDNSLVQFNWDFSSRTLVVDWVIDYNAADGTIRIQNLDLTSTGTTKTVYINQSGSSFNSVCIADDETTPISSLTSACSCSGCTRVAYGSSSGQYTCTDLGNITKVSGLSHSAVSGIQYTPPSDDDGDDDGGGGGGSGGPAGGFGYGISTVKKTVLRLDLVPDEIYRIELDLAGLALTHNHFSINKSLPRVKIIMEMIDESDVEFPLRNAYQYFRITAEGMTDDDLKNAELEFRISKDWLELRNYDENLVALNVYDGAWRKLPTLRSGTIDNELYFTSNTGKFGYFAITSEPKVIPPPVQEQVVEAAEEAEELTEEVPEERRKTWKEWLQVITISRHKYLIALGLVVLAAAIIAAYLIVSRIKHPYPKLSKYIKLSLDKGKNKNKVKKELVDSGWPENMVNIELKKYKKKNA